jgi:hypothetical protein
VVTRYVDGTWWLLGTWMALGWSVVSTRLVPGLGQVPGGKLGVYRLVLQYLVSKSRPSLVGPEANTQAHTRTCSVGT